MKAMCSGTYPFPVNVPVLHGVGDIAGLHKMFNDNGSFSVGLVARDLFLYLPRKCFLPSHVTKRLEVLVHNVRRCTKMKSGERAAVHKFFRLATNRAGRKRSCPG